MKEGLDLVDSGDPFDLVTPIGGSGEMDAAQKPAASVAASDPYRNQAIAGAREILRTSYPGERGVVRAYLRACKIELDPLPELLRFRLDHPYVKKTGGEYQVLHRGPCVLAPIHDEGGQVIGVVQIWVDLQPPHHRAKIQLNDKPVSAEIVRGSAKGGFVPLITPKGADTLVMSASIEAALLTYMDRPDALQDAAFWAGADLKNMSGKMLRQKGMRYSGLPDLTDTSSFVPPHWVKRLVFLQEGSAAGTREKLECGLKRAMHIRPGLKASIVRVSGTVGGAVRS